MKNEIDITKAVSDYIKHKGITVTAISNATGILDKERIEMALS